MLETLNLRQYRGFESYRLAGLARVNLVVGKNYCGKTSILEAIELLVGGGSISALREAALRSGEPDENSPYGVDISRLLHGHQCTPGAAFELSSPGSRLRLEGKILPVSEIGEATADRWAVVAKESQLVDAYCESVPAYALRLIGEGQRPIELPISESGSLLGQRGAHATSTGPSGRTARYLSFDLSSMRETWNDILADGRETEIVEAMRTFIPEIDSIHFLAGSRHNGILVGKKNLKARLPLGSHGNGVRRLLAISLGLAATRGGCLLIDEIDTGLHWTVMEDLWQFVVGAAQRYNVQVFATTHSFDCVKGLGMLIRSRPDVATLVAIQKVHRSLDQAVCISGEEISIATDEGIEVR